MSMQINPSSMQPQQRPRIIGRRRVYDTLTEAYGTWSDLCIFPNEAEKIIPLSRGGKLVFRPNVLSPAEQTTLTAVMQNCKLFRQYSFGRTYEEPRSHVLLSSRIRSDDKMNPQMQPGYEYHGISMKAYPMDLVPEVEALAKRLANVYGIDEWNTGVDLIAYKDGEDRIGWHADDTQGEALVVCVTVSCPEPRSLHIRPKKSKSRLLSDGDEQIEIYPSEGDAYDMDGVMQLGYEHSLPRKKSNQYHRFAIVLRNGDMGHVSEDSGQEVINMSPPQHFSSTVQNQLQVQLPPNNELDVVSLMKRVRYKHPPVTFGPASTECLEEGQCYDRRYLYKIYAHRTDQRGINGNKTMGSDSIVVSRQSSELREEDGLGWLLYTSTRKQGALGLFRSHEDLSPIRVFRSSKLESAYSPPPLDGLRTSYRYDGLYVVIKVFDTMGNATKISPEGNEQFTFLLERMEMGRGALYYNRLSLDDLCNKINEERLCSKADFALPIPLPRYDRLGALAYAVSEDEQSGNHLSRAVRRHSDSDCQNPQRTAPYDAYQIQIARQLENFTATQPPAIFPPPLMTALHYWQPWSNDVVPRLVHASNINNNADIVVQPSPQPPLMPQQHSTLPPNTQPLPTKDSISYHYISQVKEEFRHKPRVYLSPPQGFNCNWDESRTTLTPSCLNRQFGHDEVKVDRSRMQLFNPFYTRQRNNESGALMQSVKRTHYNHHPSSGQSIDLESMLQKHLSNERAIHTTLTSTKTQFSAFASLRGQVSTTAAPSFTNGIATLSSPLNNQLNASSLQLRPASISLPIVTTNNTHDNNAVVTQSPHGCKNISGQKKKGEKQICKESNSKQAQEKMDKQMREKQPKDEEAQEKRDIQMIIKMMRDEEKQVEAQEKRDIQMIIKMMRDEEKQAKILAEKAEKAQEKRDILMIIKMLRADAVRKKELISITCDAEKELEAYWTKKQKQLFTGPEKKLNAKRRRLKTAGNATKMLALKSASKTSTNHPQPNPSKKANVKRQSKARIKIPSQKSAKRFSIKKLPQKSSKKFSIKHPQLRSTKKSNIKQVSRARTKNVSIKKPQLHQQKRDVTSNVTVNRPITPRIKTNSDTGSQYLIPHLTALRIFGKDRHKHTEIKVTVTLSKTIAEKVPPQEAIVKPLKPEVGAAETACIDKTLLLKKGSAKSKQMSQLEPTSDAQGVSTNDRVPKRSRAITPRIGADLERGLQYLTPDLVALVPGRGYTRSKIGEIKVRVTWSIESES